MANKTSFHLGDYLMSKKILWWARFALVLTFGFIGTKSTAQFTDEFVMCIDGSSADNCRNSAILPDPDTGIVNWGRFAYGQTACVGVGFVQQDTDCLFTGSSYNGFDCIRTQDTFGARVPAGGDMAIACGDLSPLDDGNYSAKAFRSSCFDGQSACQN